MSQHEQVRAWDKYNEREKSKHVINGSMVYAATVFLSGACVVCLASCDIPFSRIRPFQARMSVKPGAGGKLQTREG